MIRWDYRVFCEENGDHVVREVYYGENDVILSCTKNSVEPWGESLEELIRDIEAFKAATLLPVLKLADIPVEARKEKRQREQSQNVSHEELLAKLGLTMS